MPKKIALLFAGQGAQCVGMGYDLAERYRVAADVFRQADEILGRNLKDIAWNGPMEELTKTSNCQPALYVHALAAMAALREVFGEFEVGGAAGLSLGEITAHAAAGTFDFASGLKLVQKRGEFMDEACATTQGGMAAMIGGLENDVRRLAADEDVDIANINAPNQIVISGELANVETAVGVAKEYGIGRATMLYLKLEKVLADVPMQSPRFPVISNVTGEEVETPEEIREALRDQVTGTVRWTDCMQRLIHLGCDLFLELGPGTVLSGLMKRTNRNIAVISIGDAESVGKCAQAL
jgi:[acyl-carrier-protein] S-malonyltransferase